MCVASYVTAGESITFAMSFKMEERALVKMVGFSFYSFSVLMVLIDLISFCRFDCRENTWRNAALY